MTINERNNSRIARRDAVPATAPMLPMIARTMMIIITMVITMMAVTIVAPAFQDRTLPGIRPLPSARDPGDAQDVGRARRAERDAGSDGDAFTVLGQALVAGDADRLLHHVGEIRHVAGVNAMRAPEQRQAARRLQIRGEEEDGHIGPLARGSQRG